MTLYSELAQISRDAWAARASARFAAATASRAARSSARSASATASRSARSAASRSAARWAAAASHAARSAAAAAAEAARGALSIRLTEFPEEEERLRRIRTGTVPTRDKLEPGYDVTEKDFESDEAVWALYEQWCKLYNKERDRSEMARRFSRFKSSAGSVLSYNRAFNGENYTGLCEFADGMDAKEVAEYKRKAALRPGGPDPTELLYIHGMEIDSPDQSPAHGSSPSILQ
ncbi:unnamed protein product [Miscanthus lutarioriparius]|uniref:Cathepsin propeptide inhibitor domain-containing protein n=1 Tax=Miscanthus lutarioriparius TaxID=422564 RepID=A0A811QIL9_9POAL|nr:unnamed protein product [Miscanthus lutarioriparius]